MSLLLHSSHSLGAILPACKRSIWSQNLGASYSVQNKFVNYYYYYYFLFSRPSEIGQNTVSILPLKLPNELQKLRNIIGKLRLWVASVAWQWVLAVSYELANLVVNRGYELATLTPTSSKPSYLGLSWPWVMAAVRLINVAFIYLFCSLSFFFLVSFPPHFLVPSLPPSLPSARPDHESYPTQAP